LLESGQLDIGLVAGEPAFEALSGVKGPAANLKIIAAIYSTPGMFVVRGDSPYRTIADLKGQPVVFGAKGSGLPILARYVLDGMGLDQERDFKAILLDKVADALPMLREGRVAAVWGGGTGWPTFETVMKEGGRFIAPTADDIARIRAKHGYLGDLVLPANSYAGQTEAIRSVGSWSFVLARPTLDEAVAYQLTRALHLNEKAFAQKLAQARESTAANTVAAAFKPELLHPGARRYLQEIGLLKSATQKP
jgi:TRAP transporter TAXI family solute receptor